LCADEQPTGETLSQEERGWSAASGRQRMGILAGRDVAVCGEACSVCVPCLSGDAVSPAQRWRAAGQCWRGTSEGARQKGDTSIFSSDIMLYAVTGVIPAHGVPFPIYPRNVIEETVFFVYYRQTQRSTVPFLRYCTERLACRS